MIIRQASKKEIEELQKEGWVINFIEAEGLGMTKEEKCSTN